VTNPPDPGAPLIEELRRFADRERGDIDRLEAVLEALRNAERRTERELDSEALWTRVEALIGATGPAR
jgi:hypothetical protein